MTETPKKKVLVSAGSKHGATEEIARRIGAGIEAAGAEVTVLPPGEVPEVDGYDAFVLGSAVYAGHWVADAKTLAKRVAQMANRPPIWLFSSGPVGDPPKPDEDPVDVAAIVEETGARDHHVFAGKLDKAKLSFAERAIMVAVRAPEGDFRNWDAIDAWARDVAKALTMEESNR